MVERVPLLTTSMMTLAGGIGRASGPELAWALGFGGDGLFPAEAGRTR